MNTNPKMTCKTTAANSSAPLPDSPSTVSSTSLQPSTSAAPLGSPKGPAAFTPPVEPPLCHLDLARQLIPRSVRDRKFRADSFLSTLDSGQRLVILRWLDELPVAEVQRRMALPPPEGLGLDVHYTSLWRLKSLFENIQLTTSLSDAMDTACDTLESEGAGDVAPLRETISLLLHSVAINQLRRNADLDHINKTITAISRIEKLRARTSSNHSPDSNLKSRASAQKLKLDVTVSTARPSKTDPSVSIADIKIVRADPPADPPANPPADHLPPSNSCGAHSTTSDFAP